MKKQVIEYVGRPLTKRERRMFSKEHPGMRLSFWLRFPHFPLVMDAVQLVCWIVVLLKVLGWL